MPSPNFIELEKKFVEALSRASDPAQIEAIRKEFLGRKGILDSIFKTLSQMPLSQRQIVGNDLNLLKQKIQNIVSQRQSELEARKLEQALHAKKVDLTLPSYPFQIGKIHPLTQVLDEVIEIFLGLGFGIAEGPELESDENNFGALNIPESHPARDLHDTFYIKASTVHSPQSIDQVHEAQSKVPDTVDCGPLTVDRLLLRTHTSPVQIREMRRRPPPIRIIAPGKVFRHEAIDATHSSVFHQVEGLAVDQAISFADLKGTLEIFSQRFFGEGIRTRFRPSYFPFVEPGAEVDISCTLCSTQKQEKNGPCPVCKGTGWLEMLGAGMVHPNVFKAVGYDPETVSGFAFGMGIERIAMVQYGITDMRLFYENHLDFLNQF